jgi:hypothetical protein
MILRKIKLIFASLLFMWATIVAAKDCRMVVPFPPGGSTDAYATAIQRFNNQVLIEHRSGAFAAVAINELEKNPGKFLLSTPHMFSSLNPVKKIELELLEILFPVDLAIVSGNHNSIDKLRTGKQNIGVGVAGLSQHIVASQLKNINPGIEVIFTGSDVKSLPLLINGDIDAYVVSSTVGIRWSQQFSSIKILDIVEFNKPNNKHGVTLSHLNFNGIWVHSTATEEQRAIITKCIQTATSNPDYREDLKTSNIKYTGITDRQYIQKLLSDNIKLNQTYTPK